MTSTDSFREHLGLTDAERTVPTGSMWPSIRSGDGIRFRRDDRRPRAGEIWVSELGHVHACHRVLWAGRERVLLKGDWLLWPDGWVSREKLFGPLSAVRRDGAWRATNRRRDRLLGLAISAAGAAVQATRGLARRLLK